MQIKEKNESYPLILTANQNQTSYKKGGIMKSSSVFFVLVVSLLLSFWGSNNVFCTPTVLVETVNNSQNGKTTIFTAGGPTAYGYYLSNSNQWTDFEDLIITFTLTEPAAIQAYFEISMFSDYSHLVTRILVDGVVKSEKITGEGAFWSNSNLWFGVLTTGEHTIKVQYRTPKGGHSNPIGADLNTRVLQVMVMGVATLQQGQ
jgi:hypothetical protein